jgi:death-on-curing protein
MAEIQFLSLDAVLQIHQRQIKEKGGAEGILSKEKLEGAVAQPKQTFGGQYLYEDLFAMAAAYLTSIATNHPFMDGNKRTATHAAVLFLYLNGYQVEEFHQTELANLVLAYLNKKKDKEEVANFFANRVELVDE